MRDRVWILLCVYDYEGSEVISVFHSKEKAIANMERLERDTSFGEYEVEEFEIIGE